jgi:hypothetical protein
LLHKVLSMRSENQHLEALHDIRQMMQRSSRFLSLSGLSGIAAGIWGLVGAYFAYDWLTEYVNNGGSFSGTAFQRFKLNLVLLAGAVLGVALVSAFYFTWRRTKETGSQLWNHTSRQLTFNMLIPLVAGGLFLLAMLQQDEWRFVAPGCLVFYGLALVNGSKYTLSDIRYLGISEIIVGLIATQFVGYGLYFWAFGFGVLHIIYGFIMWWKNERKSAVE